MITVVTKPVLLKQSAVVETDGLKSFKFQRNIEKKMLDPNLKVIFLSAETGGGKTRGFALPALKYGKNLIIVAPTNALIFDIALNVQKLIDKLRNGGLNVQHQVRTITRYSLYVYKNERNIPKGSQGQAFLEILRGENSENADKVLTVIVTNPDSLAIALQMLYYQSEKILGEVIQNFPWLVFDEFHAYSPKQIPAIMHLVAIVDLYRQNTDYKVVFSSATPTKRFEAALRRLLHLSKKTNSSRDSNFC